MPFSHFRGGLKLPLPGTGGFTLNGFTGNRFIPPVDALWHGRSRKPFGICSCEKCARNSPAICTYKSLDLNSLGINSYQRWGGVPPSLPPTLTNEVNEECPQTPLYRPWAQSKGAHQGVNAAPPAMAWRAQHRHPAEAALGNRRRAQHKDQV